MISLKGQEPAQKKESGACRVDENRQQAERSRLKRELRVSLQAGGLGFSGFSAFPAEQG